MATNGANGDVYEFEAITWLEDKYMVNPEACRERVERLRYEGVIDKEYADTICDALANDKEDARHLAYSVGKSLLIWLACHSTPLGADSSQVDELEAWLSIALASNNAEDESEFGPDEDPRLDMDSGEAPEDGKTSLRGNDIDTEAQSTEVEDEQ